MKKYIFNKTLTVPACCGSLPAIRNFLSQVGEKYHLSKQEINLLKLAVEEACSNIFRHGDKLNNLRDNIKIKVLINYQKLIVKIIDQGKSFDPNNACSPDLLNYIDRGIKGGLGIHLMRKCLDSIEYQTMQRTNKLRLIKNRYN